MAVAAAKVAAAIVVIAEGSARRADAAAVRPRGRRSRHCTVRGMRLSGSSPKGGPVHGI